MSHEEFNRNSIDATMARIETKIDMILVEQKKDKADIEDLKKWRWFSAGLGAAVAFAAEKLFGK